MVKPLPNFAKSKFLLCYCSVSCFDDTKTEYILRIIKCSSKIFVLNYFNVLIMSDIKERIFLFISEKNISKLEFERNSGLSNGYLNNFKGNLGSSKLEGILSFYTDLNRDWLLTGEGSMLKSEGDGVATTADDDVTLGYEIPLLPVAVYGGTLDGFGVSGIMPHECEHIVSPLKNAELAVPVVGDSMSPEYPNGSRVLVRRVNDSAFLEWGAPYLLDTCNGAVLKIIAPSEKQDCIKCISLNKAPEYAPFDVSREHINGVYRVLMCMALK